MIIPKYLSDGDHIRVLSTARKIAKEEVLPAIRTLESWGLTCSLGDTIGLESNQFAGPTKERINDFQQALNDPTVNAILCARGGYGTVKLIDHLDFTQFLKQPKWIIGYSDVTVLHNHLQQVYGLCTMHASMPINFPGAHESTLESLRNALFGIELNHQIRSSSPFFQPITAPIVGGNLSILYSLTGTPSQLNTHGKILFIEDLDEYLYHIDRMMMNLDRAGMLKGIEALLVGGMSDMNDNQIPYGQSAKEIILDACKKYNFPVLFDFPAGHIEPNLAIKMGMIARLEPSQNGYTFYQDGRAQ